DPHLQLQGEPGHRPQDRPHAVQAGPGDGRRAGRACAGPGRGRAGPATGTAARLTLIEVLKRATGYLEQHGSSSPRLDAEILLAHALGLRRIDLYLQFERLLSETELEPYRELIARRGKSEPVAYLVGHKEFMGLEFEVGPE